MGAQATKKISDEDIKLLLATVQETVTGGNADTVREKSAGSGAPAEGSRSFVPRAAGRLSRLASSSTLGASVRVSAGTAGSKFGAASQLISGSPPRRGGAPLIKRY